jgi:hypothetical protein
MATQLAASQEGLSSMKLLLQGFWTFPSSRIVGTTKHDVSETRSVSALRCGRGRHLLSWDP